MIQVLLGALYEQETEGILRPIRADLVPVTSASRDVAEGAGETMNDKLEQTGAIPLGGAVITPAGDLSADFVIHAVVSAPDEAETPASVQKALRNSLRRAADLGTGLLSGHDSVVPTDPARRSGRGVRLQHHRAATVYG